MADVVIDTQGLRCPLPLLKVRKVMRTLERGTRVVVLATDPGTEADLRVYCEKHGYQFLEESGADGGLQRFRIHKS